MEYIISVCTRLLVFLTLCTLIQSQSEVEYTITEEQEDEVVIGNLITDSELSNLNASQLTGASFAIVPLPNNNHRFFRVDDGDFLLTSQIDRDQLCPSLETCIINLDIQVITANDFFLIKASIVVLDVNDETPFFREDSFEFLLSEASAIGMTLNLPTANDLDSPQNGIADYSVDNLNSIFRFDISLSTGEPLLILNDSLDREQVGWYTFNLLAIDSANPPHTGSTEVLIEVTDINDNSPEFEQSSYDVTVDENVESGYELIQVTATDLDIGENGVVLYELSGITIDTYGDLFQIDEDTGVIILNGTLDYETTQEVNLVVTAKNRDASSLFSQTRVHISIQDVNDNAPSIRIIGDTDNEVSISENTQEEEFVVHVTVSDADTNQGGIFTCSLDSPEFELVKILATDFKIMTKTTFDREAQSSYILVIVCTDEGTPVLSTEQEIIITITDVNDNKPSFEQDEYPLDITENQPAGQHLLTVIATDSDAGENGTVEYRIVNATDLVESYIEIDTYTGSITAKRLLDYEKLKLLNFHVVASDKGNPPLSSACKVTINIFDEDDNPPLFTLPIYTLKVQEMNDIGAEIGRITANDADSIEFNSITYELSQPNGDESDFSIDSLTGRIFANFTLDREKEVNHSLVIYAMGPAPVMYNTSAIVNIKVLDVNDNEPFIIFPSDDNNTVSVPSFLQKDYIVANILAEDIDEGDNALLSYHIVSGDVDGIFSLDEDSGYLQINQDFTVTEIHTSELLISVSDNGAPQLSKQTYLYIDFNETAVEPSSLGVQSRGKNENIAIIIGVLSGTLVVVLLIAILCLIRRKHSGASRKPTRLKSLSESVDGNNSIQFGDTSYAVDIPVQGYVNGGLDCDEHPVVGRPYMGENYSGITGPVKDSGSEGSNADSGHGSHEETASLPGAGTLQKWDNMFLPQDRAPADEYNEHKEIPERQIQFNDSANTPQTFNKPLYEEHLVSHPDDQYPPMTSHQPPWFPLEEYHTNQAPLDYDTNQAMPYFIPQPSNFVNDSYRESPDMYRDFGAPSARTRGNVIDLRDYERDQNECYVDEELDTFDERYRDSHIHGRMPNHMKRRSNSFANDSYPFRDNDVYPGHIAGFCTPQPKNIKYCSQV